MGKKRSQKEIDGINKLLANAYQIRKEEYGSEDSFVGAMEQVAQKRPEVAQMLGIVTEGDRIDAAQQFEHELVSYNTPTLGSYVKNVTELTWYDTSDYTEDYFQIQVDFEGTDGHIYELKFHQNIDLDWSGYKILSDFNISSDEEYDEDDTYAINDLLTEAINVGDQDTELMNKIFNELTRFDEFVEFTRKLEFDPELAVTINNKRLRLAWENGERYISEIDFMKWYSEPDPGLVVGYFKIEVGFIGNDSYHYVLTFNTHMDLDSYYHDQITEICVIGEPESEDSESNNLYEAVKIEGRKAQIVNYILDEIKEFSDYEDFLRDLKNNETFQEMVRTNRILIADRK